MRVLEFNDVHRSYQRGSDVLRGISFSLEAGEVVGLLGKNGAGKTTLIRVAIGMIEAQKGSVRVLGLDPRQDALEVKRRVGYVSEDQVLPEFLSVGEVIRLHRGLFPTWDEGLERRLRERFALSAKSKIKSLSKGQARQVALLCAVAHRPELLLLDEPAGGLDPSARREFLETSIQLLNEAGTTILFSSHHMTDVERMAGRIGD
jgi:ABC-2 type transport system ATP-binding protein